MLGALNIKEAEIIWPVVEPMFQRVVDRDKGRSSTATIKQSIMCGKSVLWISSDIEIAITTSIEVYPTGKRSCLILACAGENLETCKHAAKVLESYASDMQCEMIEIYGRGGWLRALDGYEKDNIIMSKGL